MQKPVSGKWPIYSVFVFLSVILVHARKKRNTHKEKKPSGNAEECQTDAARHREHCFNNDASS